MAVGKEVKTKITSIQGTKKITSAMELVAASKMRRAQERMALGKPYTRRIRAVVGHIANAQTESRHVYMEERDVKRVGFIVVSSDRGLCGGLNINLFKLTINHMKKWADQGVEVDLCAIGAKAGSFLGGLGGNIVASLRDLGDEPRAADFIGAVKVMLDGYEEGKIDRLYILSNHFINTMTQKPVIEQLLPLVPDEELDQQYRWEYIYEPSEDELLDGLLTRYLESQVYQAVVENKASELAARMIAMKNATENAGNLIDELQLLYNKARQAAITQELSEIVSGAAAV